MNRPATARRDRIDCATAIAIDHATKLQLDIVKHADPDWVAEHGPAVADVKGGMIYVYREWNEVVAAVRKRMPAPVIAAALIELAGVALKIGVDFHAIPVPESEGPVEAEEE